MIIHSDVGIHQYDSTRWVISAPDGRHFIVPNTTRQLVEVLRDSSSWSEAYDSMKRRSGITMSQEDFIDATCDVLENRGVLVGETETDERARGTYLRYRIVLLPSKVCRYMSMVFPSLLYRKEIFWPSLLLLGAAASIAIHTGMAGGIAMMSMVHYTGLLGLMMGAMLIHELGHIAACRSQNLEHGPIGAGIYFFIPVLYADISRVWQLPRERRLMANMGGIHAELCYLGALLLAGTLMSSATLIYASMIGATSVIYQLNPFARRDGYWVLSDATGVPNLLGKAQKVVQGCPTWIRALWRQEPMAIKKLKSPMFWFLTLYGVGNAIVIGVLATFIIMKEGSSILLFPSHFAETVQSVMDGSFAWSRIRGGDFLVLLLYVLALRLLYAAGKRIVKRGRRKLG
jgi:hypothetical protein